MWVTVSVTGGVRLMGGVGNSDRLKEAKRPSGASRPTALDDGVLASKPRRNACTSREAAISSEAMPTTRPSAAVRMASCISKDRRACSCSMSMVRVSLARASNWTCRQENPAAPVKASSGTRTELAQSQRKPRVRAQTAPTAARLPFSPASRVGAEGASTTRCGVKFIAGHARLEGEQWLRLSAR